MATTNIRAKCSICNKANATCLCSGCSKDFCFQHLIEHRQILDKQLDEIINDHDQFQQTITQQKQNPLSSPLTQQIDQWETNSIEKIRQTAHQCREIVTKLTQKSIIYIEKKFIELSEKLRKIHEENEFNEIDLNHFKLKLTQVTREFIEPSNICIQLDSQEFIKKISVISSSDDSKNSNAVEYEITIETSKKRGAGTDANVFLSIFGDKSKVERRQLKESIDRSKNLFESGATNRFKIYATDVGKIKTVRIEHDGCGIGDGWHADSVEVHHVSRNEVYTFPVDRWLNVAKGDGRIALDLEPDRKPGQLTCKWYLKYYEDT
ncbi:unnamed protein product [Adineta steineri]|uniref:PLAT domain-containing protein n=1 Tax=Adineta steineri TaxID=433720 RepID=A0A815IQP7_9BILA|nr:unnamed protein product [Adineta steineri]CAF4165923.1 unnamed protein product [Adineta steineri]